MKQGFVSCGPEGIAIACQPGTYCSDPTTLTCTEGCLSNVNCGCGEVCTGGSCVGASVCGDEQCTGGEDASSCPADCAPNPCGNGVCDAGESFGICPEDCAPPNPCGNGVCDAGETSQSCAQDCPDLKLECYDHCDVYNFFMCFNPGGLQICYDACDAASDAMLKQFSVCAASGAVSCDPSCFDHL
ncbi:hypothetical protein [Polyangium fumosum]|uniref:Uncharacterized protein n=1 Tax=Polyangium fumosum TaxID=889272 RepID=A0A4U1IXZ0_9BACT|nr:hypothetical protein [Polyangium fumosum]TKC99493.1 hypothetical protein E8A74_37840 [Polyangium fumosum]